ncbi:MAG: hypothetical protein V3W19_15270 [Desulfatiglandales bacterium]
MSEVEAPIDSPIEVKIAWAESCYHRIGDQLLRDDRIAELLIRSREAIRASHKEMVDVGVVNECKGCEEREGGSCCGAGLENRYGGVLLLINCLLGVKIPKDRPDPLSCFFLGKKGCLLPARHTICVDYLCKKITDRIDPQKISALREKEGVEVERLFFLHEEVRKMLKAQGTRPKV